MPTSVQSWFLVPRPTKQFNEPQKVQILTLFLFPQADVQRAEGRAFDNAQCATQITTARLVHNAFSQTQLLLYLSKLSVQNSDHTTSFRLHNFREKISDNFRWQSGNVNHKAHPSAVVCPGESGTAAVPFSSVPLPPATVQKDIGGVANANGPCRKIVYDVCLY